MTSLLGIQALDYQYLTLVLLILLGASVIHGLLGLGFPMLATPLLAMLTDVPRAMLMLLLPTMTLNTVSIARGGHWRQSIGRFWPLALYVACGSFAGTRLLILTDPAPYKVLLALVLLGYLNIRRLGLPLGWVANRPRIAMAFFGLIAGVLAGTVNAAVPALIIFVLELQLNPVVTVQTFNFCFFCGKLAQAATFAAAGALTLRIGLGTVPLAAICLAGMWIGMRLRGKVQVAVYHRWLRRVLLLIAVLLLVQYFAG
jgi:uncharacterized membrane protein YfcA